MLLHLGPLLHLGTFITFEASTKWREFMGGILRRESYRIEFEQQWLESSAHPTGWNLAFVHFLLSVQTAFMGSNS